MPSVREQFEHWKRAIPRQEADDFSFDSKHVHVCTKHFDSSDIIRTCDFMMNGDAVSLPRDKPRLRPNEIPRFDDSLQAYFTTPKPRPRTVRRPIKRRREPSCAREAVEVPALPTSTLGTAPADDAAAACNITSSDQSCGSACQTDNELSCCCAAEKATLQYQLRAVAQQLARCQTMLAKLRV
ncbi:hypothetical protein HPB52_006030 [Rhipicephalus sanguineus]|uniref:THAP-type domain-containing protein n=1 Tax=Rhipicephalus sanguineus TaxID=34632 RepID=A0A9D4PYJ9_RHISA|nr:hypothetical protein HPB52_006030 [Rhipicephalus sanguineus]